MSKVALLDGVNLISSLTVIRFVRDVPGDVMGDRGELVHLLVPSTVVTFKRGIYNKSIFIHTSLNAVDYERTFTVSFENLDPSV